MDGSTRIARSLFGRFESLDSHFLIYVSVKPISLPNGSRTYVLPAIIHMGHLTAHEKRMNTTEWFL